MTGHGLAFSLGESRIAFGEVATHFVHPAGVYTMNVEAYLDTGPFKPPVQLLDDAPGQPGLGAVNAGLLLLGER